MTERTIHFISLGCPKNRVDTEVMLGVSDESGFRHVADPADAQVIVVNTCGFIGPAKEESIDTILEMGRYKEAGTCERLVVSGCLSQRYPEQLASEMPEVDHFLGSSDMLKLRRVLDAEDRTVPRMLVGNPADYTMRVTDPRRLSLGRSHSAYVKIAEGCSRKCSFCSIPSFRGTQRSRPIADVVAEVERLVAQGLVEVNLISQDTMGYGRDFEDKQTLAELVRAVADVPGISWVRLFYLYPEKLTPELVELLAHHPKVLPYVDMPLQHASDNMLKRMRRGHGGTRLREVVERLRKSIPSVVFRTAFIVGHPGETAEDFDELQDFVRWAEFDHVGVFQYSHEEGTHSGTMGELVPARSIASRHRKLMTLQRPISRRNLKRFIGTEIEVLVEGESDESEFLLEGRHKGQAPDIDGKVYLANGEANPGEIRRVRITAAADYDLVGDLMGPDGEEPDLPAGARKSKKKRVALNLV